MNLLIATVCPMMILAMRSQTEERLPLLKGEFLTGRAAVLPDAAAGKVALLALGFAYDSRWAVEAWISHFQKEFGDHRDVTFYEIPMIGGMARLGKWFIDSGMRPETGSGACDYGVRRGRSMEAEGWIPGSRFSLPDSPGQSRSDPMAVCREIRRKGV